MNNSESETMETATPESPVVRRELSMWEKILRVFHVTISIFCGENALTLYILFHWLLACATHISYSDEESTAFISFLYFMSTLIAFLAIMSRVSGLLIPLFLFCNIGVLVLFFLFNITLLNNSGHSELFRSLCEHQLTRGYCKSMREHELETMIKTALVILFYSTTCTSIVFQFARNEEYARNPANFPHPNNFFQFHPHLVEREVPVGPTNLDEPPRYSTLEPLAPPKSSGPPTVTGTVTQLSTVTSPPRYSYWERTFGRSHQPPPPSQQTSQIQQSSASDRSKRERRESTIKIA